MNIRVLLLIAGICTAIPVLAAEEEEDAGPWTGSIKIGYLATSGNTETSSLNSGAEAHYKAGQWHHDAKVSAVQASEDQQTTAEAYEAGWTSGWDFTDRDYLFGRLNWRKDRFAGIDTQFSQTVGYGRRVIDNDVHTLNLDAGFGARQSEDQAGVDNDETIITGGLDYKWQFSETADFTQTLAVEVGEDNTYSESVTAISATLVGAFRLVASYTIKNNSEVPVGTEKTDTRTALSLEYNF